jgi:hypothetical protein
LQETLKANPYVYVDNDPVNAVDPSGQTHLSLNACIVGVAFLVARDLIEFAVGSATLAAGLFAAGIKTTEQLIKGLAIFLPETLVKIVVPVVGYIVVGIVTAYLAFDATKFVLANCVS